MLPVTSLNGSKIGSGLIGEGFNNLIQQWSANTGVDIIDQIKKWGEHGTNVGVGPTPYQFKTK